MPVVSYDKSHAYIAVISVTLLSQAKCIAKFLIKLEVNLKNWKLWMGTRLK